ncbi:Protein of unknown function [Pilibacter termitis]|uniref:DUF4238 domain-containing protein n=1 Tax=Pilibacter termitis TaxID=263852 RepID=A0A1T4R657_9ENTE|nr:DUF4238 domain-containing protein [Pilibacter termitis]SKA11550.1 Protein of unknown function [Pilibacter termitis]
MTSKTKKQHYVPQFYLRKFEIEDNHGKIYAFDKKESISRQQAINNVASENYFYDHDLNKIFNASDGEKKEELNKLIENNKDDIELIQQQYMEKWLSKVEANMAPILESITRKAKKAKENQWYFKNCYCMSDSEKTTISHYVAIQFSRTKRIRETLSRALSDSIHAIGSKFFGIDGLSLDLDKESEKLHHENVLLNKETLVEIAQLVSNHIWIIYINETKIPFWTSDVAISLNAMKGSKGIAAEGVEILFPLGPKIMLAMYEKTSLIEEIGKEKHEQNGIEFLDRRYIILANEEQVKLMNLHQLYDCSRFVFSNEDSFEFAKANIASYPDFKNSISKISIS